MKEIEIGYYEVLMAVILTVLSLVLVYVKRIPLVKEISVGSIRVFVQLIAVGYLLEVIFNTRSIWLVLLAVTAMLLMGAYTAGKRAEHFKGGFSIAFISMAVGSFGTLALMMVFRIISAEARYMIPLAGMIVNNSMNSASITFNRIGADLKGNRLAIETALSLGKSWREASRRFYREAVKAGMISIVNFLETAGIVALPGAMTGMILAGVSPLKAVLLQIIVAYMLLSSVTITSIMAGQMAVARFFNDADQFVG